MRGVHTSISAVALDFCRSLNQTSFQAGGTPLGVRYMTDQFIRRQNIEHFRHLLETVTDENERRRILKLLEEE